MSDEFYYDTGLYDVEMMYDFNPRQYRRKRKGVTKMSTKTVTTVTVAQIADKLEMSPKVARRKLRDAWDTLPKAMREYVEKNGWVFTRPFAQRATSILADRA